MNEDHVFRLEAVKRFGPTIAGFGLGCLVFSAQATKANHGVTWLLLHALTGPFEKAVYDESAALTHSDIFFGVLLGFIMCSHVFSLRRQTVFLSLIGAFLWVAAAIGHYR